MNAKRLFTILILLVALFTASACSAKKEANVRQAATQLPRGTQVVNQTQVVISPKIVEQKAGAPSADQPQNDTQATASGDIAMLNYQTSGVHMIIKDAEIELLVENTDRAIDQVTQLTADYGGYLISSQSWYDGDFKFAAIRLAVPSEAFETALTNLRHIGLQVVRETGSGQDVSTEYTDLQSRLTNLEATSARVREFLNAAQTVDESLKVNQQLSDLEAQIEQIKGQMSYYEGRSSFSTITANLTPQRPTPTPAPTATPTSTPAPTAIPTPRPGWNPANTFNNATGVSSALYRGTVDVLIWLIVVFGPIVLILGLIIWVVDHFLHLRSPKQANRPPSTNQPPASSNPVNPTH